MRKAFTLYSFSSSKSLAFTALFAALCCIGTIVIVLPLPFGYFNAGDVFVLLAAWCLGPLYGSVAAAVGSALADIVSGYAIYAPATFFIKGLLAFTAYTVWFLFKKCVRRERLDPLPRLLSAVAGETVMVCGYFAYEWILYGLAGATATIFGNLLQGVCGVLLATAIIAAIYPIKNIKQLFPALRVTNERK